MTREPGHLQTLSLLHGFLLGPKGTDVTKPMASSLIRIERWPPAQLMEGCGNQADSSITPRAEPGQPRPNELGCDGAAEGQPGVPGRTAMVSSPLVALRGVERGQYLILCN